MRQYIVVALLFTLLIGSSLLVKNAIIGGGPVIKLSQNPLLVSVSKSLQGTASGSYISIAGKDYVISGLRQFENGQWIVVNVSSVGVQSTPATIVLQKSGQSYAVVAGPGSLFQRSDLVGVPTDVVNYIGPVN